MCFGAHEPVAETKTCARIIAYATEQVENSASFFGFLVLLQANNEKNSLCLNRSSMYPKSSPGANLNFRR